MSSSFEVGTGIRRRYAAAVIAREVLRDVALCCAARGVAVMPLKGAFFQLFLYADPAERTLSDLDVLVPEADFEAAIGCLLAASFRPLKAGRSLIEVTLQSPRGFPVDLHRRLFSPGRYRLQTADVFRRSTPDSALISAPLALAHPLDTTAHLIGKFASDHVQAGAEHRLVELARVCAHYGLEAAELARHLVQVGMARAARYTLAQALERLGDPLLGRTLSCLPESRLGAACAEASRAVSERYGEGSPLSAASAHLLNHSLPAAAGSLTLSCVNRLRHYGLSRARGRAGGALAPFFASSMR